MLEIVMTAKMHSQETLFRTIAARLNERLPAPGQECPGNPLRPDIGRTDRPAVHTNPQGAPTSGKKRRRRRPLRMTPKAQRRRWFKQHSRRMRARALWKAREATEQPARDDNPADRPG